MSRRQPLCDSSDLCPRRAALILIAAVALVFGPLCGYGWTTWDDIPFIAKNPPFANPGPGGFAYAWTSIDHHIYIPLTRTIWMLLALAGYSGAPDDAGLTLNAQLFHTANVLIHAGSAVAVFAVLRALLKQNWPALAGALVFALHPVQVETVGWISGLKDVLGGALSFAAIAVYLQAIGRTRAVPAPEPPGTRRRTGARGRYIAALILFIAAMLAKPSSMTAAAVLIAIDALLLRRPIRTVAAWAGPWLVAAALCAVAARLFQPVGDDPTPLWARPLIVGHSLAFYARQLVWPATLGIDYGHNPTNLLAWPWLKLAWIVPAALLAAGAALYRRWRMPLAAMAVFAAGAAHTLGLVGFDFQKISTTADHYLYVSMLGAAMLAGWLVRSVRRGVGIGIVAVVVIALAGRSVVQVRTWRDSGTLFAHGLVVNPESWAIRTSVAALAMEQTPPDIATAMQQSRRAIELEPAYALPYVTLGAARAAQGDLTGATAAYRQAVERSPDSDMLTNLGSILAQQQQFDEAGPLLERAVALNPRNAQALLNLGALRLQQMQLPQATRYLERAVALAPNNASARLNLGIAHLAAGNRPAAVPHLRAAYRLNPALPGLAQTLRQANIRPN